MSLAAVAVRNQRKKKTGDTPPPQANPAAAAFPIRSLPGTAHGHRRNSNAQAALTNSQQALQNKYHVTGSEVKRTDPTRESSC